MLNKLRRGRTDMKSFVVRLLVSTVALTAVLLLVMLALASANTEFFDRYYSVALRRERRGRADRSC